MAGGYGERRGRCEGRALRAELALFVVLPACVAAALAAGVLSARDAVGSTDHVGVAAAPASAEAAATWNRLQAETALRALASLPGVVSARIEQADGTLLAEAGPGPGIGRSPPPGSGARQGRPVGADAPLRLGDRKIGRLALVGRAQGADRLFAGVATGVLVAAAALLAGWLAARRTGRRIAGPVDALVHAMEGVRRDHAVPESVEVEAGGATNDLVAAFNGMLGELRARDASFAAHVTALQDQLAAVAADLRLARSAGEAADGVAAARLTALRREVRAPLEGLTALAGGLAAASGTTRRQRRSAQAIARSGPSLLAVVDEALDGAAPAGGERGFERVPVDVADVVEDVAALFWAPAASRGLDLAAYVDPATPRLVAGDAIRLRQVIGALVNRAVASTAAGGVLIEVEPDTAKSLRFSVHDTGAAIPRDAVADAFLACRRRVDAMGGAFHVASDVGRGSTVAFRLPMEALEAPAPWPGPRRAGDKVLVTCAGLSSRRAAARYLARSGYGLAKPGDTPVLALGDAAGLRGDGRLADLSRICLSTPADDEVCEAQRDGLEWAVLPQPFRRCELQTLLARIEAGEPLHNPALADGGADAAVQALASACGAPTGRPQALVGVRADAKPRPALEAVLSLEETAMLRDLQAALAAEQLSLAYQLQVDRDGEQIDGVEALLRWAHPVRGPISPALFIPLAEKAGLVGLVTTWVVDRLLAETRYLTGLKVAFNASALEFGDPGFVDRLSGLIRQHDYDPKRLVVEITETAILQNEDSVRRNIDRLRALGLKVALDDFGAGYSSIGHLRRYPFDKLKIDREFITDCSRDMQSATVVHAVVSIGRALGMKVIAEGVENETQMKFLKVAGVHAMQGFLFGRPMGIDELSRVVNRPLRFAAAS